jgi:hypothetical protein
LLSRRLMVAAVLRACCLLRAVLVQLVDVETCWSPSTVPVTTVGKLVGAWMLLRWSWLHTQVLGLLTAQSAGEVTGESP